MLIGYYKDILHFFFKVFKTKIPFKNLRGIFFGKMFCSVSPPFGGGVRGGGFLFKPQRINWIETTRTAGGVVSKDNSDECRNSERKKN